MARKKKIRRQADVPVASMGDIAFLLIIFFLLLSEFNKDKSVPMTLPESGLVEKNKEKPRARVDIDEEGQIYIDGNKVVDSKDVENTLSAMLKDTVADAQRHVQFKCDTNLTKDVYEPILQAIAEAGGIIDAVGEKGE
jgi:biopolymer transport protein ExbD